MVPHLAQLQAHGDLVVLLAQNAVVLAHLAEELRRSAHTIQARMWLGSGIPGLEELEACRARHPMAGDR